MTTEKYKPPFFERENSRYDIVQPKVQNALLISYSGRTNTLACKGICCTYGWNDSLQNIFNDNELCIKYHLLSLFCIKVVVLQQKESFFR